MTVLAPPVGKDAEKSGPPSPDFSRRIPELDGLRGVAVFVIVLGHYIYIQAHFKIPGGLIGLFWKELSLTWTAVDLFFVLSGFLIGGILLDHRDSPRYFSTFYLRRFWRIVPIYGVVCCAFWVAGFVFDRINGGRPSWLFEGSFPWYSYVTFTQNIWIAHEQSGFGGGWLSVTWSLAVEEQFYLIVPLVVRLIKISRLALFVGAVLLSGPLIREVLAVVLSPVFLNAPLATYVIMPCHMDGLAAGMLAAWAVRNARALAILKTCRIVLLLVILAGAIRLGIAGATNGSAFSGPMQSMGYLLLAVFFAAVLLYSILFTDSWLSKLLRLRLLGRLGLVSYGVYLIHEPVYGLCYRLILHQEKPLLVTTSDAAVTLLAALVTLIIAGLSWRFFEKPLMQRHRAAY